MAYYYLLLLLSCFCCCNAQPLTPRPPPRNVYDFKTSTWNTNGQRWDVVAQLILQDNLDVMVIQEAGSISNIIGRLTSPATSIPVCFGGFEPAPGTDVGLTEHIWNVNNQRYYIYYYNNNQASIKQNMAIISRYRAEEMIVLPNQVTHGSTNMQNENAQARTFINRPVIGIRIENGVFFNIHPEPNRVRNEAPLLLQFVEYYMQEYYEHQTWMVMGDFNRTPQELRRDLPQLGPRRYWDIVGSNQPTHGSAQSAHELDYAIVGGPTQFQQLLHNIAAVLANLAFPNPSDHKPVRFN